jgi:hypothetical protein
MADFEDKRSLWEKAGSLAKNFKGAVKQTAKDILIPETIKAGLDPERDVSLSDVAWDSLYLLPFVRPLGKAIKTWVKSLKTISKAGKTAKEIKALKAAEDAAKASKTHMLPKNTPNVKVTWPKADKFVVDADAWKIIWSKKWVTTWTKDIAKSSVDDLIKMDANVVPKEKTIVKELFTKFKDYAGKVNKTKFIDIVKRNPKKILWAAAIALLSTVLDSDEEPEDVVDKDVTKTIDTIDKEHEDKLKEQETKEKMITWLQGAILDDNPALIWGKLPHKLFSDELGYRWTPEKRDEVDKYLEWLWLDFVWNPGSAERNVWIANAIAWLKHWFPEEFKKLQDELAQESMSL